MENLANLKGIRYATSNEIPDKATYNDMAVKMLSSRDTITAKKIYCSVMNFQPSHTLWIRSNHKPSFNVRDGGMLRRLALIPFLYKIPTEDRIERYEEVLLKESSGILNWILDGWKRYQKEGLYPLPDAIVAATDEYTSECDILTQFINEAYVKIPFANTMVKDFTTAYNEWCKANKYPPSNSRTLASELRTEGFEVTNGTRNQLIIKGLGVKDENVIC